MNPIVEESALPTTTSNPDVEPIYVLGPPVNDRLNREAYEYGEEMSTAAHITGDGGGDRERSTETASIAGTFGGERSIRHHSSYDFPVPVHHESHPNPFPAVDDADTALPADLASPPRPIKSPRRSVDFHREVQSLSSVTPNGRLRSASVSSASAIPAETPSSFTEPTHTKSDHTLGSGKGDDKGAGEGSKWSDIRRTSSPMSARTFATEGVRSENSNSDNAKLRSKVSMDAISNRSRGSWHGNTISSGHSHGNGSGNSSNGHAGPSRVSYPSSLRTATTHTSTESSSLSVRSVTPTSSFYAHPRRRRAPPDFTERESSLQQGISQVTPRFEIRNPLDHTQISIQPHPLSSPRHLNLENTASTARLPSQPDLADQNLRSIRGIVGIGDGWAGGPQNQFKQKKRWWKRTTSDDKSTAPEDDPLTLWAIDENGASATANPGSGMGEQGNERKKPFLKDVWNQSVSKFGSMPALVDSYKNNDPRAQSQGRGSAGLGSKMKGWLSRSRVDLTETEGISNKGTGSSSPRTPGSAPRVDTSTVGMGKDKDGQGQGATPKRKVSFFGSSQSQLNLTTPKTPISPISPISKSPTTPPTLRKPAAAAVLGARNLQLQLGLPKLAPSARRSTPSSPTTPKKYPSSPASTFPYPRPEHRPNRALAQDYVYHPDPVLSRHERFPLDSPMPNYAQYGPAILADQASSGPLPLGQPMGSMAPEATPAEQSSGWEIHHDRDTTLVADPHGGSNGGSKNSGTVSTTSLETPRSGQEDMAVRNKPSMTFTPFFGDGSIHENAGSEVRISEEPVSLVNISTSLPKSVLGSAFGANTSTPGLDTLQTWAEEGKESTPRRSTFRNSMLGASRSITPVALKRSSTPLVEKLKSAFTQEEPHYSQAPSIPPYSRAESAASIDGYMPGAYPSTPHARSPEAPRTPTGRPPSRLKGSSNDGSWLKRLSRFLEIPESNTNSSGISTPTRESAASPTPTSASKKDRRGSLLLTPFRRSSSTLLSPQTNGNGNGHTRAAIPLIPARGESIAAMSLPQLSLSLLPLDEGLELDLEDILDSRRRKGILEKMDTSSLADFNLTPTALPRRRGAHDDHRQTEDTVTESTAPTVDSSSPTLTQGHRTNPSTSTTSTLPELISITTPSSRARRISAGSSSSTTSPLLDTYNHSPSSPPAPTLTLGDLITQEKEKERERSFRQSWPSRQPGNGHGRGHKARTSISSLGESGDALMDVHGHGQRSLIAVFSEEEGAEDEVDEGLERAQRGFSFASSGNESYGSGRTGSIGEVEDAIQLSAVRQSVNIGAGMGVGKMIALTHA